MRANSVKICRRDRIFVVAIRPVPDADFTRLFVRLGPRDPVLTYNTALVYLNYSILNLMVLTESDVSCFTIGDRFATFSELE